MCVCYCIEFLSDLSFKDLTQKTFKTNITNTLYVWSYHVKYCLV